MLPSNMSHLASNLCGVLIILLGCLLSVHCQSVSVSGIPSSAVKDDEITAICVTDGTLSPSWYRNDVLVTNIGTPIPLGTNQWRYTYTFTVDTNTKGVVFKCQAANPQDPSNISSVTKSIVDVYYTPILGPIILPLDNTMVEGNTVTFQLLIYNAYPAPAVTWTLQGVPLQSTISHSIGGIFYNSTSYCSHQLRSSDNKQTITASITHRSYDSGPRTVTATLDVKYPPGSPSVTSFPSQANENDQVTVRCAVVGGNPAPFVWWTRNDIVVDQTQNSQELNNELTTFNDYTFSVQVSDSTARFVCNTNNSVSSSAKQSPAYSIPNVFARPTITSVTPASQNVLLGQDSSIIRCTVQSQITYNITWYFVGSGAAVMPSNGKYALGFDTLVVKNVQTSDDNVQFRCLAMNDAGVSSISSSAILHAYAPPGLPVFYDLPSAIIEGVPVTLRCQSSGGWPYPVLRIFKGNTVLAGSSSQAGINTTISYSFNPTVNDKNSVYRCEASNQYSSLNATYTVIDVYVQPSSPILVGSGSLNEGTTYTWYCNVDRSYPPVNIKWYIGTDVYNTDTTTLPTLNIDGSYRVNSSVTVVAGAFVHEKQLTCEVTHVTLNNPLTSSLSLFVTMKPSVNLQSDTVQVVEAETDVTIRCSVVSTVNYEVFWYKQPLIDPISKTNNSDKYFYNGDNLLIRQVGLAEAGQFYCKAENIAGFSTASSSANVVVFVSPGSPIISFIPNGRPTQGNTVTIDCYSRNGNPSPTMFLYNNGSLIMTSSSIRQSSDGEMEAYVQTTIIASFTERRNTFRCIANNTYRATEAINMLNDVYVVPTQPSLLGNFTTLLDGRTYTWECVTSRVYPVPIFSWTVGSTLPSQLRHQISFNTEVNADGTFLARSLLTISPVQATTENGRVIRCQVSHGETGTVLNVTRTLTVHERPSVNISKTQQDIINGTFVNVICYVTSTLDVVVTWLKDGNTLPTPPGNGVTITSNSGNSLLSIETAQEINQGRYSCRASNDVGDSVISSSFDLNVISAAGSPIISNFPTYPLESLTYDVECAALGGDPAPVVTWYKNGVMVDPSLMTSSTQTGTPNRYISTLSMRTTFEERASVYTCIVSNAVRNSSNDKTFTDVLVQIQENTVSQITGNTIAREGVASSWSCEVNRSNPYPQITWFFDGVDVTSSATTNNPGPGLAQTFVSTITYTPNKNQNRKILECVVTQTGDNLSAQIKRESSIVVEYRADTPVITGFPDVPIEGVSISATCTVTGGQPTPNVTWYRNGVLLKSVYESTPSGNINTLVFEPSINNIGDTFSCVAANPIGNVTSSKTISNVYVKPGVPKTNAIGDLLIGKTYSFWCNSTSGRPDPAIKWTLDNNDVGTSQFIPSTSGTRESASRVTFTAEGSLTGRVLRCTVSHPETNTSFTEAITITVHDKPTVTVSPLALNASLNQNKDLSCTVSTTLDAYNVSFYKEGSPNPILADQSKYWISKDPSNDRVTRLLIQSLEINDSGNYYCIAANLAGVSERPQSALLMLYTEPDITGLSPPSVVAKEGDRVDITCDVNVSPATFLTLTWTKGNTAISNQKTLTFTSINRNQDGNYVCSVSNSLGSDSHTATIAVQYKPEAATSDTDRTIEGTVGSLQTLTCATNSNPAPTEFVWLKDDQVLATETGRSMEVRVESTNTIYKCRATNSVGVSSDISFFVSSSTASGASTGASTSEGGLTVAEIVIIVLCIVLFIVIIVVICFCCCLKAKEKDVEKEKEKKVERTRVAPQEDRFYKKPLPPPPGLYQRGSSVGDYEEDYVTSPDYTAFFIQAPRERDGTTISMGGHGGSPRQPRRLAPLAPLATNYEEEERRRKKARRNKKKKRQIQREDGVGMESPRHHANTETAEEIEIPEDTYTMSQKIFIGNDD